MKQHFGLAALALSLVTAPAAAATLNQWAPIGPQFSTVLALEHDPFAPANMLAGTYFGGLYRSNDYGFSWTPVAADFSSKSIFAIAFDPSAQGSVYVGTFQGGVYRSADGGLTWTAVNTGLTALDIQALAVDPSAAGSVIAATSTGGVFRTTNSGGVWTRVDTATPPLQGKIVVFDPGHASAAYLGTIGAGLYRTSDGGATWTAATDGVPAAASVLRVRFGPTGTAYAATDRGLFKEAVGDTAWTDITGNLPPVPVADVLPHPIADHVVFAAGVSGAFVTFDDRTSNAWQTWTTLPVRTLTVDPTGSVFHLATIHGGLQLTTDNGTNWITANTGIQNVFVGALAVVNNGAQIVYAGSDFAVHRLASGAWDTPFDQKQGVFDIAPHPTDPNTLYIGTERGGVWKSADAGRTWYTAASNIVPASVNAIAESADGKTLYAATSSGLYISPDHGGLWTQSGTGALSIVLSLAADPTRYPIVYVGGANGIVLRSDDGGWSFMDASHGLPNESIVKLVIAPWEKTYAITASGGLYATSDNGLNWFRADTGIGQSVTAVTSEPTRSWILYAATSGGGVVKSQSGSLTWTPSNTGLSDPYVFSVAVDPRTPATVYAGGLTHLFKSADSGGSWTAVGNGLPSQPILSVVIDDTDSSIVYASLQGSGVYRSTDAGATFAAISSGIPASTVVPIAVSSSQTANLYAGTVQHGVYRSTDRGDHWAASSFGMTLFVRGVAIDPQTPDRVYAGSLGAGVFRSLDAAATWESVGLSDRNIFKLAIDPVNPANVYAATSQGVAVTHDHGATWANAGQRAPFVYALAVDPATRTRVFVGTAGGLVHASDDGGRSWRTLSSGLPPYTIDALAIDAANGTLYAAPERQGFYRSSDGGATWTPLPAGPVDAAFASSLTVDASHTLYVTTAGSGVAAFSGGTWRLASAGLATPQVANVAIGNGSVIFAATYDAGVFKSADGGASWQWASNGLTTSQVNAVVVDPSSSSTVYAATPDGVFLSRDAAASWSPLGNGLSNIDVTTVVVDPATPGAIYAATNGNGVFRSTDGGASWQPASTGLLNLDTRSIALGANPGALYAGTIGGGLARSTDGALTWSGGTSGGLGNNFILGVAVDPQTPQTVYAATAGQGVLKSINGGADWSPLNNGLGSLFLLSLAIDHAHPQTLYTGSSDGGVFVTTNGGTTWQPLNDGLFNHVVTSLAIDPNDSTQVFAGTEGGGVFGNHVAIPVSTCTYSLSTARLQVPSTAASYNVSLTTGAGCAWQVASASDWISISSATSGTSAATVSVSVAINIGQDARSGLVFVAGTPVTIVQSGLRRLFRLTVSKTGSGSGAVTSDWAGISCGTDCVQLFTDSLPVVLTPTADRGSAFAGWSGDADCADGAVTMSADRHCIARFELTGDFDGDGLPDIWELQFGLDPASPYGDNGALGDPDHDGVTNIDEYRAGTHPRGFFTTYMPTIDTSIGASTEIALFNPNTSLAHVLVRVLNGDGTQGSVPVMIGPETRRTIAAAQIPSLGVGRFAGIVESDLSIVADRTVTHGPPYASDTAAAASAALNWYIPGASTQNGLAVALVLFNPQRTATAGIDLTLLPSGAPPITRHYDVAAGARIEVNTGLLDPSLASATFVIVASASQPVVIEADTASMDGRIATSLGAVSAPSGLWFTSSGQTDSGMQTFLDLFNPTGSAAQAQVTYLLPSGGIAQHSHAVGPFGHVQIVAATDDGVLQNTGFGAVISSGPVPIVATASRWWPGLTFTDWYEGSAFPALSTTGTEWAVASGEVGLAANSITRLEIANTSAARGSARVRLVFDDGTSAEKVYAVMPLSRTTIDTAADFPAAAWRQFSAHVFSEAPAGTSPAQIIVERTILSSPDGLVWAAGTHVAGVCLRH